MEILKQTIQQILEKIGFKDFSIEIDSENRKISILINDGEWLKEWLPKLVSEFNYLVNLIYKKTSEESVFVDINNYRKERERLIVELAKAAARKALMTKEEIKLPAMNAYERRLIHVELSTRPDVKTESVGSGVERGVIVKPI
ncbi:MAG: R3H domain-containing nucleic acid-binding protein [Patescibacteria group bacterium]